jgi:hypothetical protein
MDDFTPDDVLENQSSANPYQAPKAAVGKQAWATRDEWLGYWRDGKQLVVRKGTELPDRCVKCNAPAEGYRLRRNLSWHAPAWYLLILISLLIYIIVYFFVRNTAKLDVGVCPAHRRRRVMSILAAWIGIVVSIGLMVAPLAAPQFQNDTVVAVMIISGIILLLTSIVFGILRAQIVTPARIDKEFARLKGVCWEYLEQCPDWGTPALASGGKKPAGLDVLE